MRVVCLVVALAGCGRLGFDATASSDAAQALPDAPAMVGVFRDEQLPPGGHVRSLALQDPTSLASYYVGYAGGRIFRIDNGAWTECASVPGDPRDLSVADDGTLYVAAGVTADQIAVSTDRCASFTVTMSVVGLTTVAATMTGAYVGTSDGVWQYSKSTRAFSRVTSPIDGHYVQEVRLGPGGRIGVAAEGIFGLYNGTDWSSTSTGADANYHYVFDPVDPNTHYVPSEGNIYKTTTNGSSYSIALAGYHDLLAVDPANTQRLIIMEGGELEQSLDGLTTVQGDKRNAVTGKGWPLRVIFDPAGSGRALMTGETGVFMAADASLAWTRVDTGVCAWWVTAPAETSTALYAGTSGDLMVSQAGGPWTHPNSTVAQSSAIYGVLTTSTNPDRVYTMGDALERSDNRGTTFSTVLPSSQTDGWIFYALAAQGTRLWAASYARLTYSDDGTTWMPVSLGGVSRLVHNVIVRANGTEIVAATDGGIWWSTDGSTFLASNTGLTDTDLRGPLTEVAGIVFVGTRDGIWSAPSQGATWTPVAFSGKWIRGLVTTPGGALVAAVEDGVFVSHDNGASWSELEGLATYRPWSLAVGQGGTLLVGTKGHGLFRTPLL